MLAVPRKQLQTQRVSHERIRRVDLGIGRLRIAVRSKITGQCAPEDRVGLGACGPEVKGKILTDFRLVFASLQLTVRLSLRVVDEKGTVE